MKSKTILIMISLFPLLSSCNFENTLGPYTPKDADKFARNYIEIVRTGNIQEAIGLLNPQWRDSASEKMRIICRDLGRGQIRSIKVVGSNIMYSGKDRRSFLTYEIEYPSAWMLVEVVVDGVDSNFVVWGLHANSIDSPLEVLNAFTLKGKPDWLVELLVIAGLEVIFILFSLFVCVRSDVSRKWIWMLVMIIGVGKFSVNWTTGFWDYQLFYFQLLGVGIQKNGEYAPWILALSFPLGALIFWGELLRHSSQDAHSVVLAQEIDPSQKEESSNSTKGDSTI